MLNSHQNLLTQRPSDQVRIGDYLVDLSLREIAREGAGSEPVRITVKALGVLMALIAHAGKVVGREALLEWVWPDTMPNDDVVTQAITQLRKAFGESRDPGGRDQGGREQTAYIETISKHGYRLVAPVEWVVPAHGAPAPVSMAATQHADIADADPVPAPRHSRQGAVVAGVLLAVALLAGIWFYDWFYGGGRFFNFGSDPPRVMVKTAWPDPARTFQRVASTPDSEMTPSLSPDGALIAYSRSQPKMHGAGLVLQPAAALPPRPITEAVPGRVDTWPAWSPDGQQIAFIRNEFVEANRHRCAVMLISAIGSGERELAPCLAGSAHPIGWYPDGSALIASNEYPSQQREKGSVAIHRLPLQTGRWERIEYTREATDVDASPAVSPDGRWIAFSRRRGIDGIWRMPVAGGHPRLIVELPEVVQSLTWMPDSEHLLFSRRDRSASKPTPLSRIRIDGSGLSDYTLEGESIFSPSVALPGGAVAFEIENTRTVLRRIRIDQGENAHAAAIDAYETSLSTLFPSLSPDGTQIVFVSNRSGRYALWWAERAQPDSLRPLQDIKPAMMQPVTWDATSTHILAIGEVPGGYAIFEIEPRTGRIRRLPYQGAEPLHAAYHPDPRRLLVVAAKPNGDARLALYDRSVEPWRELAAIEDDVQMSLVDQAGDRILFARTSKPEIWQTDLALTQPRLAGALQEKVRNKTLTVTTNGAWVLDSQADCTWYLRPILSGSAGDRRTARCLGRQMPKPLRGVGYDAATGELYISVVDRTMLDIGLLVASGRPAGSK